MGAARSNLDAFSEIIAFQALSSSAPSADEGMDNSEIDAGEDVGLGRWQVKLLLWVWVFASVILPSIVILGRLTWARTKIRCSQSLLELWRKISCSCRTTCKKNGMATGEGIMIVSSSAVPT